MKIGLRYSTFFLFLFFLFPFTSKAELNIKEVEIRSHELIQTRVFGENEEATSFERKVSVSIMKDMARENYKKKILFLLPGGATNFQTYVTSSPTGKPEDSLFGKLALKGHIVAGFNPAFFFIPGKCQGLKKLRSTNHLKTIDCSFMSNWTFDKTLDDMDRAIQYLEKQYPDKEIIVGGISFGAISTWALMNRYPNRFAGALVIEGIVWSSDKNVRDLNVRTIEALKKYKYVDNSMVSFLKIFEVINRSPAPIRWAAKKLIFTLLGKPQNSDESIVPNYTLAKVKRGRPLYSHQNSILNSFKVVNSIHPVLEYDPFVRSLAGQTDELISNLSNFTSPVYLMGGGRSFGKYLPENATLLGTPVHDITIDIVDDYGHVDHLMNKNLSPIVMNLENWLESF
jgi:pimeloyl-ACP methyl ester carboxylesterase